MCAKGNAFQNRILFNDSTEVEYVPTFNLSDGTDIAFFHSNKRREKEIETSANMTEAEAMMHLQKPFIKKIGTLKIEVNSESFLKHFLRTCDTKVRNLEMVSTAPLRKDMFTFQEELSQTLIQSVKKIHTNKSFEKTCHRFKNLNSVQVQNFPAMNNLLMERNDKITKVDYIGDSYASTITIKNTFVTLNDVNSEAFYCDSVTAHFSKEDVVMCDD